MAFDAFAERPGAQLLEGDVLYAAPMTWHQMGAEAASGPSVRLAMKCANALEAAGILPKTANVSWRKKLSRPQRRAVPFAGSR